jgi:O-antigen/teichoic acid export membrane protein
VASHLLADSDYGDLVVLWAVVFLAVNVLYRPVEQFVSRAVADSAVRGRSGGGHVRAAGLVAAGLALAFVVVAILARGPAVQLLGDSDPLFLVLLIAVPAYAGSYVLRGLVAGSRHFVLYGTLTLTEALVRLGVVVVVSVAATADLGGVAAGIAIAPCASLAVALALFRRRSVPPGGESSLHVRSAVRDAVGFAVFASVVAASEQVFLNAGSLVVSTREGAAGSALAGFAFNALLIVRAPVQVFQAVQTSLLPHLAGLAAGGAAAGFRRSVRLTMATSLAFGLVTAAMMLLVGPDLLGFVFGSEYVYGRGGLAAAAVGMGLYLAAVTLNQAALAAGRARAAAVRWAVAAAIFVGCLFLPGSDDVVAQVEVAFAIGALVLAASMFELFRRLEPVAGES